MNFHPLSLRDRIQLALLRLLSVVLGTVDNLFHIQWGERLLGRMASRWEARLAMLDEALALLEQERRGLHAQAEALAIQATVIYLAGRSLAHDELRFDPADPHDEEILDAIIELLVKEQLAAIEMQEIEPERYVYRLEPDWPVIRTRLAEAAKQADPAIGEWLRDGLKLIDETFLGLEP
jgi:hypothetical protein